MWHCFALRQVSLMSDVTEVTWILIKEFNSLPHLTSYSIREAPLPIWQKQEWRTQCHGVTPIILLTLQIPQEGTLRAPEMERKDGDERQSFPLRLGTAKTLYSCQAKRRKVVRKGHCAPLNPSRKQRSGGGLCRAGGDDRDLNLDTHKSSTSGERPGHTAF